MTTSARVVPVSSDRPALHPVHAVLLAGMLPLFLGALFSDVAYGRTYEVQWVNFAAWLNAGALVLCGFTLLWAVIDLFRADRRASGSWLYVAVLAGTFGVGFVGALVHAKDAWATMPGGLILSVIVAVLAVAAVALGFGGTRKGAVA